MVKQEKKRTG